MNLECSELSSSAIVGWFWMEMGHAVSGALAAVLRTPWNGHLPPCLSRTSIHLRFCSWHFTSHPLLITTISARFAEVKSWFCFGWMFPKLEQNLYLQKAAEWKGVWRLLESWVPAGTGSRWVIGGWCRPAFILSRQIWGWTYVMQLNTVVVLERLDKCLGTNPSNWRPK